MIPYAKPIRRAASALATRPSGVAVGPVETGTITAELVIEYAGAARMTVNAQALTSNLSAALAAADAGASRAVLDGAIATEARYGATPTLVIRAPMRVLRMLPARDLSRAMARAAFWSVAVAYPDTGALARPASDGGSRLQALVDRWPSVGVDVGANFRGEMRANFSVARRVVTAVPPAPPAPTTPSPAPTPARITTPPLGKPQSQLSRDEIVRYQRALIALGFSNGGRTVADGAIGTNTRASVTSFQQAHQRTNTALPPRVQTFLAAVEPLGTDGNLGPATQRALDWYLLPVDNGGNGLSIASVPVQGGRAPAPTVRPPNPSTPQTNTPPVRPPTPPQQSSQASMSGGTIALAAIGAAIVGVGIAYRDTFTRRTLKRRRAAGGA